MLISYLSCAQELLPLRRLNRKAHTKPASRTTMGPTRTVKTSSKLKKGSKNSGKPNPLQASTKSKVSKKSKAPPPKQQKTKSTQGPPKKKKRVYTEKELGIPKLNMITPIGVDLPKGKKKGKVFVDDQVGRSHYKERMA